MLSRFVQSLIALVSKLYEVIHGSPPGEQEEDLHNNCGARRHSQSGAFRVLLGLIQGSSATGSVGP